MWAYIELISVPIVGILLAFCLLALIYLNGTLICKKQPALGFIIILSLVGSVLSVTAWLLLPLLPAGVLAVLCCGALLALRLRPKLTWKGAYDKIAFPFLFIPIIYSAIPYLRFDQWNYHLVIPKYISLLSNLPTPIYDDHIYFTGAYEFVFVLFRLFTDNDLYVQSSVNVFSVLAFVLITIGALKNLSWLDRETNSLTILTTALILVLFPDFMALSNAKADILLVPIGLYALALYPSTKIPKGSGQILFGLIMTIPLLLKITWLTYAAALGLVFIIDKSIQKQWMQIKYSALGAIVCLPPIALILYKTWYFLGNPLHPMQNFLFSSGYWSPQEQAYWNNINRFVTSFNDWYSSLAGIVWFYIVRLSDYLVLIAGSLILAISHRIELKPLWQKHQKIFKISASTLFVFILIWPLAYGTSVKFERFKESSFALILPVLVFSLLALKSKPTTLKIICFIALLAASKIDLRVMGMARYLSSDSLADYFENKSNRYVNKIYSVSQVIEQHRARFPYDFYSRITIGNSPVKYFFSRQHIDVSNYNLGILLKKRFKQAEAICVWQMYKDLRISYLFDFNYLKAPIIAPFNKTKAFAEKLSDKYEIYYFSDEVIERQIKLQCQPSSRESFEIDFSKFYESSADQIGDE